MRRDQKGFTVAELLIVVAIIAVLVAVGIPIFTSQLEKSREATDLANVRSAYAEVMAAAIIEDDTAVYSESGQRLYQVVDGAKVYKAVVSLKQKQAGWKLTSSALTVGGIDHDADMGTYWIGDPSGNDGETCSVIYDIASGKVTLYWEGEGAASTETQEALLLSGVNEPLTRASTNWAINSTTGLLAVSTNQNRVSLTATPIKLSKGATAALSTTNGYKAAFYVLKYVPGQGFVQVKNGGWTDGTSGYYSVTATDDNTYIVVNTKNAGSTAITAAEANANTKLTITGNTSISTAGLSASAMTGAASGGLSNSVNGAGGGTLTVTTNSKRAYASQSNVSAGSVISLSGNEDYNLAYFFVGSDNQVLYDSGWMGNGASSSMVVPEDCTVYVQAEGSSKLTDQQMDDAVGCIRIYSK